MIILFLLQTKENATKKNCHTSTHNHIHNHTHTHTIKRSCERAVYIHTTHTHTHTQIHTHTHVHTQSNEYANMLYIYIYTHDIFIKYFFPFADKGVCEPIFFVGRGGFSALCRNIYICMHTYIDTYYIYTYMIYFFFLQTKEYEN